MGYVLARMQKRDEAKQLIKRLEKLSEERYVPPYNIAIIYSGLQDRDRTIEWLNKGYEQCDGWLVFLKVEKALDFLRTDPRFQDLFRRIGFSQ